jgi:hypothetical protein
MINPNNFRLSGKHHYRCVFFFLLVVIRVCSVGGWTRKTQRTSESPRGVVAFLL